MMICHAMQVPIDLLFHNLTHQTDAKIIAAERNFKQKTDVYAEHALAIAHASPAASPPAPPAAADARRPASGRGGVKDDDLDGRKLVEDAVRRADRANWAKPTPNLHRKPMEPSESDCFRDNDFMSRVDVRQNDLETLRKREEEVGVQFIDTLHANGAVFRDDVPTSIIPDRGLWNGTLEMAKSEDEVKPICKKPYRLSPDETRAAAAILRDLMIRGTIRPSKSPWGTPVFLVPTLSLVRPRPVTRAVRRIAASSLIGGVGGVVEVVGVDDVDE